MLTVHASEAFILYNKLTTSVSSNQKVLEKSKIGHFYLTIPVPQEDRIDLFTNPEQPFVSNSLLDKNVTSGGSIHGFHSLSFRAFCFGNAAHFFYS